MNRHLFPGFLLGFIPGALVLAAFGVLQNVMTPLYIPLVACMAVPGGILAAILSWLGREISQELGSTRSGLWGAMGGFCATILLLPFLFILSIVVPSVVFAVLSIQP